MNIHDKYHRLKQWMAERKRIAVAFSGGVDSTFLLFVAKSVLGKDVVAFTVKTPYIPDWEVAEAGQFCETHSIQHEFVHMDTIDEISANPVNRCYLCKHHIFGIMKARAAKMGYSCIIDGTNADDSKVYRPGMTALQELQISSPLLENEITKQEIRQLSVEEGLPTADKPSYACLLTRLPYNYTFSITELKRIEKAEAFLSSLGFAGTRVRHHGNLARIETQKDKIAGLIAPDHSKRINTFFHEIGYEHITIDLEGYRSGSFDININLQ